MNNFYALIYLTRALNHNCIGHLFHFSTSPHKNVWESYIAGQDLTSRLVFSANPGETALFTDQYRPAKRTNITKFFNELTDKKVLSAKLAENDRFITILFEDDFQLLFRLFGNKPNIFLIRDQKIIESFKSPDDYIGKPPPEPRPPSTSPAELKDGISPKKAIIKTDPKFPRHLIPAVIDHYKMDEKSTAGIRDITMTLSNAMLSKAEFRVLKDGNLCLIPQNCFRLKT
jgi:hypothetical protein